MHKEFEKKLYNDFLDYYWDSCRSKGWSDDEITAGEQNAWINYLDGFLDGLDSVRHDYIEVEPGYVEELYDLHNDTNEKSTTRQS